MKGRRTSINFSKHLATRTETDTTIIYIFAQPGTNIHATTFIISHGITAVTGDFGNWIFDKHFALTTQIDEIYFLEKLHSQSYQNGQKWNHKKCCFELEKMREKYKSHKNKKEWKEINHYINNCQACHEEIPYIYTAYHTLPSCFTSYDAIFETELEPQLQAVFDAFECMSIAFFNPKPFK